MFCSVLLFATCYTFWPERKVVSCCIFFRAAIYFNFLVFSTPLQHYWLFCFLHHCSASLQSSQATGASVQTGKTPDLIFWDLFIKATKIFWQYKNLYAHMLLDSFPYPTLYALLYYILRLLISLYILTIQLYISYLYINNHSAFLEAIQKKILGTEMPDSPCLYFFLFY